MTTFFDSHAHLADPVFDHDRVDVIARARQTGATGIVCIGESLAAAARARDIAAAHPDFVRFTAGVHPHDAAGFEPLGDPRAIADFLQQGAVAVGECGLDYHYDNSPRDLQRRAFAAQLAVASDAGVPIIVHTREAESDTGAMVEEAGGAGIVGVLHCFTGSLALAERAIGAGWYISFSGIITFRKWTDDALLRLVPATRLLVESDAPYLAPVPHRGHRNEPAWVSCTLAQLAAVREVDVNALGEQVSTNARQLFNW